MFKDGIVFGIFVLILIAIFYTISNNKLRLAMAIAFVGLAYINLQIGANAVRHIGFYWIVFICSAWLNANNKKQKLLNYFLIVCLAVQSYWGLRMYTLDVHHPFSMAPKTVGYIKQYFASQKTFVGYGGMSISGPSAYLGMPIINIKSGVAQLYYNWNAQENITTSEIVHDNLERLNNIFLKMGLSF
jgi:hypothetical protein